MQFTETEKKEIIRKMLVWLFFELCLPVGFAVLIWPISKFILNMSNAFEKILSGGDLLIVGALVLLGTSLDIIFDFKSVLNDKNIIFIIILFDLVLVCLFLYSYGFLKTKSISLVYAKNNDENYFKILIEMNKFAKVAVVSIMCSCIAAIVSKLLSLYFYLQKLKNIEEDL